jgi:hypothetical protein
MKMKKIALVLLSALAPGLATAATCHSVAGFVRLTPDAACTIQSAFPSPSPYFDPQQCYRVSLRLTGYPPGTGYAGVSVEPVSGLLSQTPIGSTPVFVPRSETRAQEVLTARSVIAIGSGAARTQIYTSDIIVVAATLPAFAPVAVTEQILVTGTDGAGNWAGASGYLAVLGSSIGRDAPVRGQLCR